MPFSSSIPNAVELLQLLCQRIASERMPTPMLQLGDALKVERIVVDGVLVLVVNIVTLGDGSEVVFPDVPMEKAAPRFCGVEIPAMVNVLALGIASITLAPIFQNLGLA
jgi:hypothetical protein